MIKKFYDFLNERLELILEAEVAYSSKFRKILSKIDTTLSKKLLEIENADIPVRNNYFDISDTNDAISFIPDRKVQDLLKNDQSKFRYTETGRFLNGDEKFQYLWDALELERSQIQEPQSGTIGKIGKEAISPSSGKKFVVFIPDDENYKPIPVNIEALRPLAIDKNDPIFFKTNRQTIAIGRGIRAIATAAKIEFVDKDIEELVNKYKATLDSINDVFSNFEEVSGDDIAYWYNCDNYESNKGQLGSSCMSDVDSEYFDIYVNNPDKVKLVIYKSPDNPDKIKGRAILWKLDDGKMYMDRIYTNADSDIELFRQYSNKNGWYYKFYNSSTTNSQAVSSDGKTVSLNLKVSLKPVGYESYPYLDTLKYYSPKTGIISTENTSYCYLLEDTSGGYISCEDCGGSGFSSCYECDGAGESSCYKCDGNGDIECDNCGGCGDENCSMCDGSGSDSEGVDCKNCSGNGTMNCTECDGKGKEECSNCSGDGTEECSYCYGNGNMECSSCN
jgi:hypothetical protein